MLVFAIPGIYEGLRVTLVIIDLPPTLDGAEPFEIIPTHYVYQNH